MGLCAVCFAHAVFPSALTSFIFPNHPPLTPVYKLSGPLSQVMRGAENPFLSMLREVFNPLMIKKVCVNFLSLFPPVLWILAVFALALRLTLRKGRFAGSVCSPGQWLLLAVWFLLFFLPFFKVYREQVHLAYPVVPMSVVFAALMRDMTDMLRTFKISSPRWIFAALLALVIGDHALNVYGSFMVVNGMNNGITRVADWIKNNTAPRSIFVCNSGGQGMEILFHSGNYFEPCWQDPLVYPSRNAARASTEEGMARMIDEEKGRRKIYLLDSSYDIRGMSVCFCHKYLRGFNFRVKKLGRVHTTRVFYPFLDPLKHFVPYEYISFLSSPDLQTEFYTGPAQDGSLFLREFHVNYDIYEVLGVPLETKITASSMLQPELGPGFLLKGTDPTWHAAAPVVFPQTLTFEFPRAKPVSLVAFHPQGEPSWPEPHYSAMIGRSPKRVGVETSDDGAVWREICVIDPACSFLGWNYHTLPAPVTAKFIRLKIYSSVRDGLTLKGVKFTD
jgi:hypothetical protein